jgi:membrane-associated protease RseP (regulator of RpoE activity)
MTEFCQLVERLLDGKPAWVNPVLIFLMMYLVVLIHECGHLIAALCMGATPIEFNVGHFPRRTVRVVRGCSIVIGIFPRGKVSYVWNGNAATWRRAIVVLAGPAISGIVAFVVFKVIARDSASDRLLLYGFFSAFDCILNALPIATDGFKLCEFLVQGICQLAAFNKAIMGLAVIVLIMVARAALQAAGQWLAS